MKLYQLMHIRLPVFLLLGSAIGCDASHSQHDPSNAHHDHGDHGNHDDHESDTKQVTIWTDAIEAFVEYEDLIVNEPSRMLVHLTWLDGHQPLIEGKLTVHLEGDGMKDTVTVDAPARKGIFIPTLKPSSTKGSTLWLELSSNGRSERIDLGSVSVADRHTHGHDHGQAHDAEESEKSQNTISFLKEQAWAIPFQTHPVTSQPIYQNIEALGQWTARPEDWYTVIAPTSGTLLFGKTIPYLGAKLQRNDQVISIETDHLGSDSLSLRWQEVQAQWRSAKSEYERNQALHESGILSQSQWNQIEERFFTTKAQYDQLASQTQNGHSIVRNPIDGYVSEVFASAGSYVEQGTALYKLVTQSPSLLQLSIPHRHHDALKHIQQVEVQIDGEWTILEDATTTVGLSLGEHHTIPVQVFTSPQDHVFAEEKTPVRLVFGAPTDQLVIPSSALLEEYGQYSVIKQLSGEEFIIQSITIGDRNGDSVAITSGLQQGDWVVSTGNYTVKMVSESGALPAHGHAH